ncbi:hypothetical protein AB0G05_23070 [Nonomuraea wenchangensis]
MSIAGTPIIPSRSSAEAAGQTLGLDTPMGRRLASGGAFLERVSLDGLASAERRCDRLP